MVEKLGFSSFEKWAIVHFIVCLTIIAASFASCGRSNTATSSLKPGNVYTTYAPAHNVMGNGGVAFKNTDQMKILSVSGNNVKAILVTNDDRNGIAVSVPAEVFVKPEGW